MAVGATGNSRILLSAGVHPHWRSVVKTFAYGTGHEIVDVPLVNGVTDSAAVPAGAAGAVVGAYPNYLGVLEDPRRCEHSPTSVAL
jgi:glycine dehydrogenase subunit 1